MSPHYMARLLRRDKGIPQFQITWEMLRLVLVKLRQISLRVKDIPCYSTLAFDKHLNVFSLKAIGFFFQIHWL